MPRSIAIPKSNMTRVRCPACDGIHIRIIGELIHIPGLFELTHPGWLHRCSTCHLFFRRPFLASDDLRAAYKRIPETHWIENEERQDQVLAFKKLMKLKKKGAVLDVGCYRGDFLQRFPAGFSLYGIEPSRAAAQMAQARGIRILGDTLEDTDFKNYRFDIVSLVDVLEHIPSPFLALKILKPLLNPDGILLVTTGNTGYLPWRLMRLGYWYYMAEHVSFFNPQWFRWVSQKLGLRIIEMERFSHQRGSFGTCFRQVSQGMAFLVFTRLSRYHTLRNFISRVYPFNHVAQWKFTPPAPACRDHLLVIFQAAS